MCIQTYATTSRAEIFLLLVCDREREMERERENEKEMERGRERQREREGGRNRQITYLSSACYAIAFSCS